MRVLFVLPGQGGGGGAHSVVQETLGLQRLGATMGIATTGNTMTNFRINYPELGQHRVAVHIFMEPAELGEVLGDYDIACATTWESVHILAEAVKLKQSRIRTAYYVQDYEPLFCQPGSETWQNARRSYNVLRDTVMFAKTGFLCDLVEANHSEPVRKVAASIDHGTYFPGARTENSKLVISAMLRPKTPRRAPRRTARILEMLVARHGDAVELVSFGCPSSDLAESGIRLSRAVDHRGALSRREVAEVMRASDLFLDLSDYQAFGRTGLEGMACGCIPLLPVFGGAAEYLKHLVNGYLVDTRSDEEIMAAISAFVATSAAERERMRFAAIETALNYTIDKAAFSEFTLFRSLVN